MSLKDGIIVFAMGNEKILMKDECNYWMNSHLFHHPLFSVTHPMVDLFGAHIIFDIPMILLHLVQIKHNHNQWTKCILHSIAWKLVLDGNQLFELKCWIIIRLFKGLWNVEYKPSIWFFKMYMCWNYTCLSYCWDRYF